MMHSTITPAQMADLESIFDNIGFDIGCLGTESQIGPRTVQDLINALNRLGLDGEMFVAEASDATMICEVVGPQPWYPIGGWIVKTND